MKLTHSPLLWKGPWSIDHLPMPHTYILASKSILSACKYILVPLLLNKEQTSKVLEKTSQADPTSILSFIVSFLGKGILYTCSINLFIFHSLLFKMTSLMHDFFNVSNSGAGGNERIKKKKSPELSYLKTIIFKIVILFITFFLLLYTNKRMDR